MYLIKRNFQFILQQIYFHTPSAIPDNVPELTDPCPVIDSKPNAHIIVYNYDINGCRMPIFKCNDDLVLNNVTKSETGLIVLSGICMGEFVHIKMVFNSLSSLLKYYFRIAPPCPITNYPVPANAHIIGYNRDQASCKIPIYACDDGYHLQNYYNDTQIVCVSKFLVRISS